MKDIPELRKILDNKILQVKIPDADTYNKILNDMVIAFYHKTKSCQTEQETEKYCRNVLNTCITGFKKDGMVWNRAPGRKGDDWFTILAKRLKLFRYDIEKRAYIDNNRVKKNLTSKIEKEYNKKEITDARDFANKITNEFGKELTLREKTLLNDFKEKFRKDFPMSISIIDDMMMNRLGLMYVLSQRDYEGLEITSGLTNEITKLAESLGVSGKQRLSLFDQDMNGTLEQLIDVYKETKKSYLDIDKEFKTEELQMIVNAIERGTIDEFMGMDYIRRLFGNMLNDNPLTLKTLKEYLKSLKESDEDTEK